MKKTLLEVSENILTDGIFHVLSNLDTNNAFPFLHPTDTDYLVSLETDYYLNHSGGKQISPYVERLLEEAQEEKITSTLMSVFAHSVLQRCGDDWMNLMAGYMVSVDPTAGRVETRVKSGTDETAHTGSDTDTRSPLLDTTTSRDRDKNYDEKEYRHNGFNSVNSSPVDNSKENHAEEIKVEERGSDETVHEKDTTDTITYDTTDEVTITPSGVEIDEAIKYHIDLWSNLDFVEHIFNDIDKILTSPIYL